MKQILNKNFIVVMIVIAVAMGFSACGSDDDDNTPSNDRASAVLAGTYKGSMTTYPGSNDFYDVTLTITELKDGTVKITANKGNVTEREIDVKWNGDKYIIGGTNVVGILSYTVESKVVEFVTVATKETDITYSFKGTKQ